MKFKITPDFSAKVFSKVAELAKEDFDLNNEQAQIDFCDGFVDFLKKEANLSPAMALGVIQYFCERGAEWAQENSSDKVAAEETWSQALKEANEAIQEAKLLISLEEIKQKEAGFLDSVGNKIRDWTQPLWKPTAEAVGSAAAGGAVDGSINKIQEKVNNFIGNAQGYLSKGWDFIKNNMGKIAPVLATGLAGALATRAIGGSQTPAWMTGLGGLAAGAGGHMFFNQSQTGQDFKKQLREQANQWFQSGK
jgi:hypothetical protein